MYFLLVTGAVELVIMGLHARNDRMAEVVTLLTNLS